MEKFSADNLAEVMAEEKVIPIGEKVVQEVVGVTMEVGAGFGFEGRTALVFVNESSQADLNLSNSSCPTLAADRRSWRVEKRM